MITVHNMENGWHTIGIVMLTLLIGRSQSVFAKRPACTRAHLEIRQIALDSPGMSKTNAFFAILNTGKKSCHLTAQLIKITERADTSKFSDTAPKKYTLLPLRGGRFAGATKVIGFNVSNDGASGPVRNIRSLVFELADGKTFSAAYEGYDTSPFDRWAPLIHLSKWHIFPGDQCMLRNNKPLSFIESPEIDTEAPMTCG